MTEDEKKEEKDRYNEDITGFEKPQKQLEIHALKQLKKMGLHLYKATNNQSEWERLTLDPNPSDPKKPELGKSISCN